MMTLVLKPLNLTSCTSRLIGLESGLDAVDGEAVQFHEVLELDEVGGGEVGEAEIALERGHRGTLFGIIGGMAAAG
jgi:hypothetical protein